MEWRRKGRVNAARSSLDQFLDKARVAGNYQTPVRTVTIMPRGGLHSPGQPFFRVAAFYALFCVKCSNRIVALFSAAIDFNEIGEFMEPRWKRWWRIKLESKDRNVEDMKRKLDQLNGIDRRYIVSIFDLEFNWNTSLWFNASRWEKASKELKFQWGNFG